jgi:hypothetical protein
MLTNIQKNNLALKSDSFWTNMIPYKDGWLHDIYLCHLER